MSWNAAKAPLKTMKYFQPFKKISTSDIIVCLQEILRWKHRKSFGGMELLSHEFCTCGFLLPSHLVDHISDTFFMGHFAGLVLGTHIIISLHITHQSNRFYSCETIVNSMIEWTREQSHKLEVQGLKPIITLGTDANVSFDCAQLPYVGDRLYTTHKSHTIEKQVIFL